ncbi:SDR family NAD(P)-dependent oxidoreductase [Aurantiacibacter sp. MUD61]|uniref:SDR family NAD(P)-dependent oxidoreductase n=1 Tax=Aurantiacibacter sp. MUD61 TaxID=3009083 RepID=UPI0022EFE97A|nr:glucose 1-dehydrogenase [Aurantiacibacter sp. MUD61]
MSNLAGKVALVTGGSRDIGRAVCTKLASQGAKVAVNYFDNEQDGDDTVNAIQSSGGEAIKIYADLTKAEDVNAMVAQTVDAFGERIDILVNVAGGLVARKTIDEMDEDFFNFLMQLNVTSTFLATKAAVPHMSEGSVIVNFASLAGRDGGGPGASAYATAKGAVMTWTRAMSKELGPRGIRVNALCPGMIATKFHDDFSKPEARKNVAAATDLKREGTAEETANVVAYLVSEKASFLSGVNLDVNGGLAYS